MKLYDQESSVRPFTIDYEAILQTKVTLGEYQASMVSHRSVSLVIFLTSAKANRTAKLYLTLLKHRKTFYSPFYCFPH